MSSFQNLPPGIRHNTPPIKNTKQWRPATEEHGIYKIQTRALHSLNKKKHHFKRVVYICTSDGRSELERRWNVFSNTSLTWNIKQSNVFLKRKYERKIHVPNIETHIRSTWTSLTEGHCQDFDQNLFFHF